MKDYRTALAVTLSAALAYRDMTQAVLAAKIGTDANTVWRWCSGLSEMKGSYIAAVADALDIPDEVFSRPRPDRDAAMRLIADALARRRAGDAGPR